MSTRAVPLKSKPALTRERVSDAEWQWRCELACRAQVGALAGGTPLNIPAASVCVERVKKFGRMGQYDAKSSDWVASMALVEKNYPDYKE